MTPLAGKCTAHRVRRWDPSRDSAEVARIYKESLLSEGLTSFGTRIDSRHASEYAAAAVQQLARQHSRKHSASQAARQLRPLEQVTLTPPGLAEQATAGSRQQAGQAAAGRAAPSPLTQDPPAPAPPAPALRAAWPRPGWLLPRLGWGLYPNSSNAGLGGSQAGSTAPLNGGGGGAWLSGGQQQGAAAQQERLRQRRRRLWACLVVDAVGAASQATLASCSPYSDEAGGAGSQQCPSPAPRLHDERQPGGLRGSEVSQAGLEGWSGWRVSGIEACHPAPGSGQVTPAHTSMSLQQAGEEGGRQAGFEPQSPAAPTSNSPGGSLGGLSLPAAAAGPPAAAHPAGPVAPLPQPPEARPLLEARHLGSRQLSAYSGAPIRPLALLPPPFPSSTPLLLHVTGLAVCRQQRGKGVARALLRAAEKLAVRWQRTSIWLEVAEGNTPALNLYRQEGYVPVRQLGWPWRSGVQVCMRKVLRRRVQPVSPSHVSHKRAASPSRGNCNRNTVATETASRVFVWVSAEDD
ncbi:hypothetical protein V8C86DRAFT_2726892 [Haematococcus lacustris]